MTPRRFAWVLRARGADLSTWPAPDRAEAVALLRSDAGSRALLADTLASEADGSDTRDGGVDTAGLCRMQAVIRLALAPATPVVRALRWGALAGCVAAGTYLGVLTATETEVALGLAPTIETTSLATVLAALDP